MNGINWSGINSHSIAGRLLRLPTRMLPGRTLLRIRRGPGKGFRWRVSSATHGCWLGTYETEKQAAI
jgi:hypothetical protein